MILSINSWHTEVAKLGLQCWVICSIAFCATPVLAQTEPVHNPKLLAALDRKVAALKMHLNSRVVFEAIAVSNEQYAGQAKQHFLKLDRKWRATKDIDDFKKSYLTNPCSEHLLNFQEEDDSFVEVFITDAQGLNACQTNVTSDMYQADEGWWQGCFASGKGKQSYSDVEFDESAGSQAISAYIPIHQDGKLVGITKAVIDVTSLKLS